MKFLTSISILFCLVLLVSCKSRKLVEPEKIIDTRFVKEIVRDTLFQVSEDSTFYSAWIECVNGKPILKEPVFPNQTKEITTKSNTKKALQPPKVKLDENGKLSVECFKEVETIKAQLTSYYEERLREHSKPIYIEKDLKWYQTALMWLGAFFLLLIVVAVIIKIKK